MKEDRILELLIRKKAGSITLPEQTELSDLLKDHPERAIEGLLLNEYFSGTIKIEGISDSFIDRSVEKLNERVVSGGRKEPKGKSRFYKMWKVAAVAAMVVIAAGIAVFQLNKSHIISTPPESANVVSTRKGSKSDLTLPDGTKVRVNSDTRLSYSKSFGDTLREVYLEGEAYFDVTKDASKPFLVRTKNMTVKVIGTSFNVKAYPGSDNTETTLIKGMVEVSLAEDSLKKIILRPNEKLTVMNEKKVLDNNFSTAKTHKPTLTVTDIQIPADDSMAMEVQWIKNRLVFSNMKLGSVAQELSRWYNVNVEITDPQLKQKEFSGIFEDESINEVMEALKLTGKFQYRIDKNSITITP